MISWWTEPLNLIFLCKVNKKKRFRRKMKFFFFILSSSKIPMMAFKKNKIFMDLIKISFSFFVCHLTSTNFNHKNQVYIMRKRQQKKGTNELLISAMAFKSRVTSYRWPQICARGYVQITLWSNDDYGNTTRTLSCTCLHSSYNNKKKYNFIMPRCSLVYTFTQLPK